MMNGQEGRRRRDRRGDVAGRRTSSVDLHARVQRGAYRATPSRRVCIPKPDGGRRPLAVAALEDKIVQRAVVAVLNAIYEEDFLGFSYGFRPGRGAHDALDALSTAITRAKVNFIVDAEPGMARPFPRTSHRRQAHHPPDPEMAEGGRPRRRGGQDRRQGDGAGFGDFAAPRQRLPALRFRPLGRALATARSHGRHGHRALCRRLCATNALTKGGAMLCKR